MGSSVPENHERLLRNFVGEWLFHLDDDMTFEPDVLANLLARDVEAVVPLTTSRKPPVYPVALRAVWEHDGYVPIALDEEAPTGTELVEIDACGWAGLLVRRSAIDKLGDPPYLPPERFEDTWNMRYGSDVLFCERLRAAGVKLYVDTSQRMGHIGQVTYSAGFREGQWGAILDLDNEGEVFMPWTGATEGVA
jgi:GT2 family glycosyltransferase